MVALICRAYAWEKVLKGREGEVVSRLAESFCGVSFVDVARCWQHCIITKS